MWLGVARRLLGVRANNECCQQPGHSWGVVGMLGAPLVEYKEMARQLRR